MRERLAWFLAPDTDAVPARQARGMAVVRIVLGLMWLYNVSWKRPPHFGSATSGLYKYTAEAIDHPVLPPYSWLVQHAILPNIEVFGWLVLLSETALAVTLLSGAFVRAAALVGLLQAAAIALSVAYAPGEWPWSYWLMIAAHLALLVGSAGRWLSVDEVRARLAPPVLLWRVFGGLAVVVGVASGLGSLSDPTAGSGWALGSPDPSISFGPFNLIGALVVLVCGVLLLVAAFGRSAAAAMGAAVLGVAGFLLLTAQIGFSTPVLGGNATSAAFLLTLGVVALAPRLPGRPLS